MKNFMLVFVILIVLLVGVSAQAVPFTGTTSGSWSNAYSTALPASGGTDVYSIKNSDLGGVAAFNWGTGTTERIGSEAFCLPNVGGTTFNNMFTFNGVGSDGGPGWSWSSASNNPFLMGVFTYRNGSVINAVGDFSVDLNVLINFAELGIGSPLTLSSPFDIINTPNIHYLPDGSTPDNVANGDIVVMGNDFTTTRTFWDGGVEYTISILGFSTDNGLTFRNNFSSPEGGTATAGIYGNITSVPEPATLLLLGFGLLGTAGMRRRFKK